jgi:hypothetical protein
LSFRCLRTTTNMCKAFIYAPLPPTGAEIQSITVSV